MSDQNRVFNPIFNSKSGRLNSATINDGIVFRVFSVTLNRGLLKFHDETHYQLARLLTIKINNLDIMRRTQNRAHYQLNLRVRI